MVEYKILEECKINHKTNVNITRQQILEWAEYMLKEPICTGVRAGISKY